MLYGDVFHVSRASVFPCGTCRCVPGNTCGNERIFNHRCKIKNTNKQTDPSPFAFSTLQLQPGVQRALFRDGRRQKGSEPTTLNYLTVTHKGVPQQGRCSGKVDSSESVSSRGPMNSRAAALVRRVHREGGGAMPLLLRRHVAIVSASLICSS